MLNRYLTDDVFEQLESCIEARGNLDLAKEAGVFEKGKEEQLKRHVETIYALIAQNFREITKTNPDTFTYMKVFNDILDESEPADIVLEILSLVVDLVPKSQVDTAFIALNTIKIQRQSEEILDVIRYGMSKLKQMGATAKEFDEEEYFNSENEVDSEATYDAIRGMTEYMGRFFSGFNNDEDDDDEEET